MISVRKICREELQANRKCEGISRSEQEEVGSGVFSTKEQLTRSFPEPAKKFIYRQWEAVKGFGLPVVCPGNADQRKSNQSDASEKCKYCKWNDKFCLGNEEM